MDSINYPTKLFFSTLAICCMCGSGQGFTSYPANFLTGQLRLFGLEMAAMFDSHYANNRILEMRSNLRVPRRSFNYETGYAHPYRIRDYFRDVQQQRPDIQQPSTYAELGGISHYFQEPSGMKQSHSNPSFSKRNGNAAFTTRTKMRLNKKVRGPTKITFIKPDTPWPLNSALDRIDRKWRSIAAAETITTTAPPRVGMKLLRRSRLYASKPSRIARNSDYDDAETFKGEKNDQNLLPQKRKSFSTAAGPQPLEPRQSMAGSIEGVAYDSGVLLSRTTKTLAQLLFQGLDNYTSNREE